MLNVNNVKTDNFKKQVELEELLIFLKDRIKDNPVPLGQRLLGPDEVAEFLGVSKRSVLENYSLQADFPRTIKLPSKSANGQPRWKAKEIIAWVDSL